MTKLITSEVSDYAVITDDPYFASAISSYLFQKDQYFPVLSMPRMNRPDWESEVLKRTSCINRFNIKGIFCKGKDYKVLAPFRKYFNGDVIPINKPKKLTKFVDVNISLKTQLFINKKNYLKGLIEALSDNKILFKEISLAKQDNSGLYKPFNSKKLLVLEISKTSLDVAAINYAFANRFDILAINPIDKALVNEIKSAIIKLASEDAILNQEKIDWLLDFLKLRLNYLFDFGYVENNYEMVQVISKELYLGFLINKIPVAHLPHLQSELNLLNEYYYKYKVNENEIPSFFFIDTQEADLTSEVPEIKENLNKYKCFKFELNGKYANLQNFKVYSHFFPYDVLFVTGHGSSPTGRIVKYKFTASNGKEHTAKVIEYFQFGRAIEDLVEIATKQYPLEFDGISWNDKKALKKAKISHIMWEFSKAHKSLKLISWEPYFSNKIEGVKLNDGVFLSGISSFEEDNNPIVILNSCSSLLEVGEIINFGLCRILIGTMWPVIDQEAKDFATFLFDEMRNDSIVKSFYNARQQIKTDYTRYAYVMIGTLFQYLKLREKINNIEEAKNIMASRLINSILRARDLYRSGYIDSLDLKTFLKLENMTEKFISENCPQDNVLRKEKNFFRNELNKNIASEEKPHNKKIPGA